jgi:hypothetical protein
VPLTIAALPTQIADERADIVTFFPDPKHDHVGTSIKLGEPFSCPEVFKYGYLLAVQPPVGAELTRNPLAFRFHTTGALSIEYRVRRNDSTLLDWTPAALDNGDAEVVLHRDGARGVTDLASSAGRYFIDARARNADDQEVTTSSCWEHRPLATPVQVIEFQESQRAGSLSTFSLAGDSRISQLVNSGNGVPVFENQIIHTANEPVVMRISVPTPPGANYSVTIADDIVTTTASDSVTCAISCPSGSTTCTPFKSKDPRCGKDPLLADPVEAPQIGSLTPAWRIVVIDSATGQPAPECTVDGLSATCALAPRAANDPRMLGMLLVASGAAPLFPPGGADEQTFLGLGYTGLPVTEAAVACNKMITTLGAGGSIFTCVNVTTFHRLIAIDDAFVSFAAPSIVVQTGFSAGLLAAAPYLPALVPGIPMTWDAGNDDLPGAN